MNLYLINKHNQKLDLLNNKQRFVLVSVDGLHGIETNMNESETPYVDGTTIESVKALPRGIEMRFKLRGNIKASLDYFTSYVKSKQIVTLQEIEGVRDLSIKGVVTIPPYSRMMQSCEIVLQIYCGQPYWEDTQNVIIDLSKFISLLNFPLSGRFFTMDGIPFGVLDNYLIKSFINKSDTSVGMLINILALGDVVNPRISCGSGEQNGWFMKLNLTLHDADELKINTVKGQKYITINGKEEYNGEPIINYLEFFGNDWLQLETGENIFSVSTENGETDGNFNFNIFYKGRYE